jgi:hypothetical protein
MLLIDVLFMGRPMITSLENDARRFRHGAR